MNENAENTHAEMYGMTLAEWKAAKARSGNARTRGRAKAKRPVSSLWDAVEGQMDLFSSDNVGGEE